MVKADVAIVDALRQQQTLPDKKLDALANFTRAVVKQRGMVTDITFDNFIAAGYSKAAVVFQMLLCGMSTVLLISVFAFFVIVF